MDRAKGIEKAVFSTMSGSTGNDYRGSESSLSLHIVYLGSRYSSEMRSLFLNLKDKGNPALRNEIVLGTVAVDKVAVMSKEVRVIACLVNPREELALKIVIIRRRWHRRVSGR